MNRTLLLVLLMGFAGTPQAQTFKISGRIINAAREPVAFASVQVKEWKSGTSTKEDGTYTLLLEGGKWDIIYSMVGYKTQVVTLAISKNYVQDIILEYDQAMMQDVTIKTKYRDNAADIIRNVIHHKDSLQAAMGAWSCNVYIKAVQQDSSTRAGKPKAKKDSATRINPVMAGMALTEISLKLDYASEQKIKEERIGVKKTGSSENLFYLSATEGFFDFYNNLG